MAVSLRLHTGNQLPLLARELAGLLAEAQDPPFRKEIVAVSSLVVRRWLSFEIARINGVCANVSFPFLAEFIRSLPPDIRTNLKIEERIPTQELTWAIHRLLPALLPRKEFGPVRNYLSDPDPLRLFQLSEKIGALFDQYLVYRPEMIAGWNNSKENSSTSEAWQATLWRKLMTDGALIEDRKRLQVENEDQPGIALPDRIFVFGVMALPPIYLQTFFHLAKTLELHLFVHQPSSEYFGSDLTPKQRARRQIGESEPVTGNPLLTSLGRQSSYFTELLLETDERFGSRLHEVSSTFVEPAGRQLLAILQSDILHAANRGGVEKGDPDKLGVNDEDRSLQIHSCHSPMREVEVLYDYLLDLFSNDPTLRPRDILVMTPEIETYSPLIRAVFEYPEDPKRRIPYSITDRHPRSESAIIDTFLKLLDLPTSRCTAEEIFGFISSPIVAARFEFSESDLALIRSWIQNTGIAWGIDAAHRQALGLPSTNSNTWRFGLDRLLLGYAMKSDNRRLFQDILPYDEVEGDGGNILGRFISAAEGIFTVVEQFHEPRTLAKWTPLLNEAIDTLLESNEEQNVRDLRFLRRTIAGLESMSEISGADQDIPFRIVRHHLAGLLAAMEQRGGFLTGGVTFCAIKPARSIPARVICLLGMTDEAFPRRPEIPQFDLMSQGKLGDPSPRGDDRYAFLETILSAGESLYISYIGRSIIHNQEIPPSVVISELLEYVDQAFTFPDGASPRDHLTLEHPLQAFSPRYFDARRAESRLFSYSEANAAATAAGSEARGATDAPPFLTAKLPDPDPALRALSLKDLVRFLLNPARYFLQARFGLKLREFESCLPDDEPILLDAIEKYQIRQELLTERIDTNAVNLQLFGARGVLPPGAIGEMQLRALDREAENFSSIVHPCIGRKDEPIAIDLRLGNFSLTGEIDTIYGGRIVHYRCAKLNLRDRLQAWIDHLASCATGNGGLTKTLLIGTDFTLTWEMTADAKKILAGLCDLFWQGLGRALAFFPASALAFIEAERAHATNPIAKAKSIWNGGFQIQGEKENPEYVMLFPGDDVLGDEFIELARQIWGTLLQNAGETATA